MKKVFLLIISFTSLTILVQAQDAKTLFTHMPDTILPILSQIDRTDFFDYLDSNMKAVVKNKFENSSEMTDLTPDYIRLKLTSRTTWEMKVLALPDSARVICVVSTSCAPVCDSDIRFYSTDWDPLPLSGFLSLPEIDDFFQLPDSAEQDKFNRFRLKADMLLLKATLSGENGTLIFDFTTPEYIEAELTDDLKAFLRPSLTYIWDGKSFVRQ